MNETTVTVTVHLRLRTFPLILRIPFIFIISSCNLLSISPPSWFLCCIIDGNTGRSSCFLGLWGVPSPLVIPSTIRPSKILILKFFILSLYCSREHVWTNTTLQFQWHKHSTLLHWKLRVCNTQCGAQNAEYYTIISYVYWTVHHLDSWIKTGQLMSLALFFAQHVTSAHMQPSYAAPI